MRQTQASVWTLCVWLGALVSCAGSAPNDVASPGAAPGETMADRTPYVPCDKADASHPGEDYWLRLEYLQHGLVIYDVQRDGDVLIVDLSLYTTPRGPSRGNPPVYITSAAVRSFGRLVPVVLFDDVSGTEVAIVRPGPGSWPAGVRPDLWSVPATDVGHRHVNASPRFAIPAGATSFRMQVRIIDTYHELDVPVFQLVTPVIPLPIARTRE